MAKTIPTFVAYLLSQFGCNIFAAGYSNFQLAALSPLNAADVIKLGMYFLLLDINLYQKTFRKIHFLPQGIYEMFVASFLIDSALMCVWFPVESYILSSAQRAMRMLGALSRRGVSQNFLAPILRLLCNPTCLVSYCYVLSLLFLFCVLHATRAVDFRLIRAAGFSCFVEDATRRLNKGVMKMVWFWNRECPATRRRKVRRKRSCGRS